MIPAAELDAAWFCLGGKIRKFRDLETAHAYVRKRFPGCLRLQSIDSMSWHMPDDVFENPVARGLSKRTLIWVQCKE